MREKPTVQPSKVPWMMHKQCDECPWRKDVAPGQFSPGRFEILRRSVEQGFGGMFACHKSPECNPMACVGYVVNQVYGPGRGPENFNLRVALFTGKIDPEKMTIVGPQYITYEEMEEANRRADGSSEASRTTASCSRGGGRNRCSVR